MLCLTIIPININAKRLQSTIPHYAKLSYLPGVLNQLIHSISLYYEATVLTNWKPGLVEFTTILALVIGTRFLYAFPAFILNFSACTSSLFLL